MQESPEPPTYAAAIDELHAVLRDAAKLYQSDALIDQRYAVVESLSAVHQFLVDQGVSPLALEPLFRPIDALKGQYENRPDPLFAERKRAGKPGMSQDLQHRIGVLATLADLWLELHANGSDTDAQLAAAARRFKGRWFGEVTKAQLKRARVIVSQEARDHPSVVTAARFRRFADDMVRDHGRQGAVRALIQHLNAQPRSIAIGNWSVTETEVG